MTDLICRKTLQRCQTPGMCAPHGWCSTGVLVQTDVRYAADSQERGMSEAKTTPMGRAMQILAELAQRRPLSAINRLCDEQKQVSTGRLYAYATEAGDKLAGYAFELRRILDQRHLHNAEAQRLLRANDALQQRCRALEEERAALQKTVDSYDKHASGIHALSEIERLRAEVERQRKDAERYRWLRRRFVFACVDFDDAGRGMFGLTFKVPGDTWIGCDENIDAAMEVAP